MLLCVKAMLIAPFILFAKGGFYTYLQKIGDLFSVPIFTILIVGLLTKKVPSIAAKVGLAFFIVAYWVTQFVMDVRLHFLHVLAILFLVTTGIMLLIGRWKPMPVPFEFKNNNLVNIEPWKGRHLLSLLLLLIMVAVYFLFSTYGLVKKWHWISFGSAGS